MERPESDVMSRSPRSRNDRLLNLPTLLRAYAWLGLIEAALSMVAYFFAYHRAGVSPVATLSSNSSIYMTATTMTFAGIVACQIGNVFACRSNRQSIFQMGFVSNRMLMACVGVEIALLAALIYAPPLQAAFGLAPLDVMHWLLLATFPLLLLAMEETRKALRHTLRKVPDLDLEKEV
jgi:magnesium-transporting ATPase (P-type)